MTPVGCEYFAGFFCYFFCIIYFSWHIDHFGKLPYKFCFLYVNKILQLALMFTAESAEIYLQNFSFMSHARMWISVKQEVFMQV